MASGTLGIHGFRDSRPFRHFMASGLQVIPAAQRNTSTGNTVTIIGILDAAVYRVVVEIVLGRGAAVGVVLEVFIFTFLGFNELGTECFFVSRVIILSSQTESTRVSLRKGAGPCVALLLAALGQHCTLIVWFCARPTLVGRISIQGVLLHNVPRVPGKIHAVIIAAGNIVIFFDQILSVAPGAIIREMSSVSHPWGAVKRFII
jgi:hypothetical protein